jgi:PhzF family phenazine biosynthesis protein
MSKRPYKQIDVFTAVPFLGNPLAVVLDGSGLSDDAMQRFAAWTNLSETTFMLPPTEAGRLGGADYRVRIFTPGGELPFAGHPTIGSCHAWLQAGGRPQQDGRIVQECQIGLVSLRRDATPGGSRLAFAAPALRRSTPPALLLAEVSAALGLQNGQLRAAQLLDNGPVWLGLLLDSPQTVLALQPDHLALKNLGQKVGVAAVEQAQDARYLIAKSSREARAFSGTSTSISTSAITSGTTSVPGQMASQTPAPPAIEVRAFAAAIGVNEDPVTGSLNASLAEWLILDGHVPERYTASQGTCLNRAGLVHIERDAQGQVWVGGDAVTCIDGTVTL